MKDVRVFVWMLPGVAEPVGKLTYTYSHDSYKIEAFESQRAILPPMLLDILDNCNPLEGAVAKMWIEARVEPPERPNMPDILKCVGVPTYNVFELLLYHEGRAVYDKLYLREI